MSAIGIPSWDAHGVIPPIDVRNPTSTARSPYKVSLTDLILRFNTSSERQAILDGFLRYRDAWHSVGITAGFQWLDGSFLENIETLESRPPKDIDVVTFFHLPPGMTQAALYAANPSLFEKDKVKTAYHVDGFFQGLAAPSDRLVRSSVYWYSVWSHRRNYVWKGFLEVPLGPVDDAAARALLASSSATGGAP